jgi:hypothetical protein
VLQRRSIFFREPQRHHKSPEGFVLGGAPRPPLQIADAARAQASALGQGFLGNPGHFAMLPEQLTESG